MKNSISCFLLILSSILLFSEHSDARKDMGGYWKSVMNDQPMPEAIKDLLSRQDEDVPSLSASTYKDDRFVRDFMNIRPNAIIYHSAHQHHAHHRPEEMKHDMEPKTYIQTAN